MEKNQAHAKEQWHCAAHIWITDGENVLIQLRAKNKIQYPDLWDITAAGHLSAGDTPIKGAIREYQEELGIPWDFGNVQYDCILKEPRGCEIIYFYFFKKKIDISTLKLQKEEVADVKWVPWNEFLGLLYSDKFVPHREHYRQAVIKGLSKLLS